jgi:hypothetical protein
MDEEKGQKSANEAWDEVGRQFRSLGESLASAFKSTWESEETRQHLEKMQGELEGMATEIAKTTKHIVDSEEGQKIKAEAEKAAQSAQAAGQKTAEELRPQLMEALRKVRSELDQIINQVEGEQKEAKEDDRDSVS